MSFKDPCRVKKLPGLRLNHAVRKGTLRRNTISENVEGKQADLFEEIGIDLDETVGVDYKQLELLMPRKRRR